MVIRETQGIGWRRIGHRPLDPQEGEDSSDVFVAQASKGGIGKGGIELLAFTAEAVVQRAAKLIRRPIAQPLLAIRGNVARIEAAEGRIEGDTAGEGCAIRTGMAALAVTQASQIFAPRQGRLIRLGQSSGRQKQDPRQAWQGEGSHRRSS